jgi:hypothetical protein
MKIIIYPNNNGGVAILAPTNELPFEEVCRKDVPAGLPYLIATVDVLPTDVGFRDAWEADFSNPDGYGIGAEAWFAEQANKEQA